MSISRLHRFAAATARQVACSPGGSDQAFAQPTGAFTPELSTIRSPSSLSGITTGVSEQFPRRYFQPLERHLASLHPHPAHRTGRADLPHPALGEDSRNRQKPLHVTPPATLENSLGVCRLIANLPSFVASCVRLQLGPLPSTGITRLPQYYEPFRHPSQPGPSLTSCQLIHTAITAGTSRVVYGPLCLHAVAITPAGLMESCSLVSSINFGLPRNRAGSAPALVFSRPAQRLLTLRPACSPDRL
jgi:hypothetical protein